MEIFLWAVLPYVTIVLLVGGLIWRYRYDQFGWTTRSSQLYESRLLRIGSPLFHFGILVVVLGHLMGLVIPESWTDALGVTESTYHAVALGLGSIAGFATLAGIGILIFRRRTTGPVFMATTKNDKTMYVVLVAAIITGLATTLISAVDPSPDQNYRETVAPWFRSLFIFQPNVAAMTEAPFSFHLHTVGGMVLFILWPFTRLVHAFTAPVQYLFRPYIVYRGRGQRPTTVGATRRGWAPVGTPDRTPDPATRRARR